MSYYIAQAGSTLYQITTAGVATALTLPTGVTIDSTKRPRFAILNQNVIIVNSPSESLMVDRFGTVRILTPRAPASAAILAATGAGGLTGSFLEKTTFVVKDAYGNILSESDFSPVSNTGTVAAQLLQASALPISTQTISARRLYRTTTGPGSTYFPWVDVDGNTVASWADDLSDVGLQLIAAPTDLGTPPLFSMIIEWKDRLWGVGIDDLDSLRFSGTNRPWAFSAAFSIPVPPRKKDTTGISGFLRRRDVLGVGKLNSIHKIIGKDDTDFERLTIHDATGIWATESCVVIDDTAYFLGNPFGIYTWGDNGDEVESITDDSVRGWFTTDTYFNRSQFVNATAAYDPTLHAYVVCLCSAGSTTLDRWIAYDINTKTWWGPHKTAAFTLNGIATLTDSNSVSTVALLGADGKMYKPQATYTDGAASAIDFDVTTPFLSNNTPDIQKFFGQLAIVSKIESAGTLTITPKIGGLDASAGTAITHTLTTGRERLPRLGTGRYCQLRLRQSSNAQGVEVYGMEIPVHELGRR